MMRSSEPFHHFVDDYLAYLHEVHPSGATLDGDPHVRRPRRGFQPSRDRAAHARAVGFRAASSGHQSRRSDGRGKGRAAHGGGEHPGPDVRTRTHSYVGAESAALRRHAVLEPGGASCLHACAASRAGPARVVEAPADRPRRAGGARQHQGPAGHLRQSGARDVPRRAQLHREGFAARIFCARRHAPSRRSGRRVDGSRRRDFELHPIPRGGRGA